MHEGEEGRHSTVTVWKCWCVKISLIFQSAYWVWEYDMCLMARIWRDCTFQSEIKIPLEKSAKSDIK